jgi:hypothetical protein
MYIYAFRSINATATHYLNIPTQFSIFSNYSLKNVPN